MGMTRFLKAYQEQLGLKYQQVMGFKAKMFWHILGLLLVSCCVNAEEEKWESDEPSFEGAPEPPGRSEETPGPYENDSNESRKGYRQMPRQKKEKAEKQRGDYKPFKKDSKYKSEENYLDDKSKYLIWHLPENAVLQIVKHIKTYKGGPCKRFYILQIFKDNGFNPEKEYFEDKRVTVMVPGPMTLKGSPSGYGLPPTPVHGKPYEVVKNQPFPEDDFSKGLPHKTTLKIFEHVKGGQCKSDFIKDILSSSKYSMKLFNRPEDKVNHLPKCGRKVKVNCILKKGSNKNKPFGYKHQYPVNLPYQHNPYAPPLAQPWKGGYSLPQGIGTHMPPWMPWI